MLFQEIIASKERVDLSLNPRGYVYEHDDKAGRLLFYQLKCRSASQQIPHIRIENGVLTIDPEEINDTFTSYY